MRGTFPARYEQEFEGFLRGLLSAEHPPLLYRMVRYHLGWETAEGDPADFRGKRIRPAFCLLACEALGGDWRACVPAAGALELVHNFSLVHDDIQDRDEERHHRPAVWSVWGEAQAINAGDALLALAHEALMSLEERGVASQRTVDAARLLDRRTLEMVEGQVLDLGFEDRFDVSLADYTEMIEKKTGALFDAALALGAVIAGASPEVTDALGRCGRLLGVAFQAHDDLLGAWGAADKTGKPAASDIRRRKKSLPVVYALGRVNDGTRRELAEVYAKPELSDDDVAFVLGALDDTGAREYCAELAAARYHEAINASDIMRVENAAMAELKALAAFLVERDY